MRRPADQPLRHRKARDRAMIVPLAGLVLLMPPFAAVFDVDARILGVPAALFCLFAIWAGLIAAGVAVARRLRDSDEAGPMGGTRAGAPADPAAGSAGPDSGR